MSPPSSVSITGAVLPCSGRVLQTHRSLLEEVLTSPVICRVPQKAALGLLLFLIHRVFVAMALALSAL